MEHKILLREGDMPREWYNMAADLPTPPLPPLGPDGKPITPDMLAPVFPMNIIEQEVSTQRWIRHPGGGAGHPVPVASDAAAAGRAAGEVPEDAGAHLLQG